MKKTIITIFLLTGITCSVSAQESKEVQKAKSAEKKEQAPKPDGDQVKLEQREVTRKMEMEKRKTANKGQQQNPNLPKMAPVNDEVENANKSVSKRPAKTRRAKKQIS